MPQSPSIYFRTWQLAWPMILSNISVPLLGIVDTAILGHLENSLYLGAVALGSSVMAFLYWGFGFLRMGTTGLVAQALGKQQSASALLLQSMLLGLLISVFILLIHQPAFDIALSLMAASDQLSELASSYCGIRIYSAPAVLISYTLIGWFIGQQNTRLPLLIVVSTNLINIVLDCVFIIGLDMKSDGAALATLLAEYSGLLIALFLLYKNYRQQFSPKILAQLRDRQAYLQMLSVNKHLFVRTVCLLFCFAFFTAQGAQQGDNILAANAILMQLLMLTAFGLDGFAHAVEALSGEAIGKKDLITFYQAVKAAAVCSLLSAIFFTLFFVGFKPLLLILFTDIDAVRETVNTYYIWLVFMPLITVGSYLLDGVFVGTTKSLGMQNSMLFCCFLVYLPSWYLLQGQGNHGLWIAFSLFSLARGMTMAYLFWQYSKRDIWITN